MPSHRAFRVCAALLLAAAASIGVAAPAVAQQQHDAAPAARAADPAGHPDQAPPADQAPPDVLPQYPSLHISGFGNVDFAAQQKSEGPRGFSEGQFTLHFVSALSPRVNFFGELSMTPRADAGTGNPPATGFNAEVERLIIRFDQGDQLKVSFGRFHTPINWWNTAFHHGQWLQTTIGRPEMVQFGGRFIPVHFVGALAEGSLPTGSWHLGYVAAIGNGRGNVISRGGDAGDNNARPAWLANVFATPDRFFRLQVGGSVYFDRVSTVDHPEFNERITTGYAVWQREDPEVIAEIAHVRHDQVGASFTTSNLAYYFQGAYRLPWYGRPWKPYYRFEHIDIDRAEVVFAGVPPLDGSIIGVRYDVSTYAAFKSEVRLRRRSDNGPWSNGWFWQVAFTF